VAKSGKTDLPNLYVALSIYAWAKATVDLDRHCKRERRRLVGPENSCSLRQVVVMKPVHGRKLNNGRMLS
jgi:hypothetical protein